MTTQRKSWFDGLLYVINTLVAFALMCSYLSSYVDPSFFNWFSFLGLAYPYLLLANIIFTIWWALRLKIKIILPVVAILLGYQQIPSLYNTQANTMFIPSGESLKVMSYNVRMLNHFKWIPQDDVPQQIEKLLEAEQPDILLLQEYRKLSPALQINLPYQYFTFSDEIGAYGQIIYSRFPILESGFHNFPSPEGIGKNGSVIYVDLEWNFKRLRVYNVHLASVGLDEDDLGNLATLTDRDQEEISKDLSRISKGLGKAFTRRAFQVNFLDSLLENSESTVLLAGDFNDPPSSYSYAKTHKHLEDSYLSAGSGFSRTYNRGPVPLRIDYIFFESSVLRCHKHQTLNNKLSDHFPIIAEFSLL